jgi:hypothetical protein
VSAPASRFASLDQAELATLLPELLLVGQLIDRSGMAWCISALGREEMAQIAIEEWAAASPIYTKRMQRALDYVGDDVVTIFKGLQLDIGAPPQFMDFRYTVDDPWHGRFELAHCGALMDVEPMGTDFVTSMCHDIEDPTFDATAVATNAKAQVRPVHRPPRSSTSSTPHCAWTVVIDESHEPVSQSEGCVALQSTRAASLPLAPIDPSSPGRSSYSGPLLSDLDFAEFSHSALVRMADEVCLQMQLLNLGFVRAVSARLPASEAREICVKQLTGIAGVAAERLHAALGLPSSLEGALRVLSLHPLFNPAAYVSFSSGGSVSVSPAHEDGGWISLVGPLASGGSEVRPLQAIVRAVDSRFDVSVSGSPAEWTLEVAEGDAPAKEFGEVAVTRFSTGATFTFEPRMALPITPV